MRRKLIQFPEFPSLMIRLVLIALVQLVLIFQTGCLDAYGVREMEKKQTELQIRIEDLERSAEQTKHEMAALGVGGEEALRIKQSVDQLNASKASSLRSISGMEIRFRDRWTLLNAYRSAFKPIYKILPGQSFPELALKNGITLKNVRLSEIKGRELKFVHASGIAYSDVSGLPDNLSQGWRLPPLENTNVISPDALFATKPRAALSDDQAHELAVQERENEQMRKDLDREEKKKKRGEIDVKITQYQSQVRLLYSRKSSLSSKWAYAKIKPSATDQAEIMGKLDAEISQLETEILKLRQEQNLIGY